MDEDDLGIALKGQIDEIKTGLSRFGRWRMAMMTTNSHVFLLQNNNSSPSLNLILPSVTTEHLGIPVRFPARTEISLQNVRTALRPTWSSIQCVPETLSLWIKRPEPGADHSSQSTAEVKNACRQLYFLHTYSCHVVK